MTPNGRTYILKGTLVGQESIVRQLCFRGISKYVSGNKRVMQLRLGLLSVVLVDADPHDLLYLNGWLAVQQSTLQFLSQKVLK